ncbi:hypothetical protein BDZ89DRAFT_1142342 [Hymenopellis radicata]|nr:hypothetical protein BDZ89DRAFT_1142342 [Hymenopellis radicata]
MITSGRTPASSDQPSRNSFERLKTNLLEAPQDHDDAKDQRDYAASVLAVLQTFGYDIEKINGAKVHSLFNVMTLQADRRDWFDRLEMWFEKLVRIKPLQNPEHLPVPSADLLKLHAVCCKVAHLSGAGQYIEKIWRDAEDLGVLAEDGGSRLSSVALLGI